MTTLRDPESGLLNADYFRVAVPGRVAVARRNLRPVSIVLLHSASEARSSWERAAMVRDCLRESDTVCQLDDEVLGLVLEDTPEDGAVWTAERLRRHLETGAGCSSVWAGIASYPSHTLNADQLVFAARRALAAATAWPAPRIEVARLP